MTTNEAYYYQMMEKGHNAVWDQEWTEAEEFFRRAVLEKAEDFQALTSLGYALFKLGKMDEARTFYLKAAKLSPDEPMPIEKLAQIYEAIDKLDQAAELYLHSAYLYLKEVDVEKAIQIWQHVTNINPEHLKAHNRIAYVAERIGWNSLAIYENIFLGALLQETGQVNEAFDKVKKAVSIDPQNELAINAFRIISVDKTLDRPDPEDYELEKVTFSSETKKQIVSSGSAFDIEEASKESQYPINEARQTAVVELANLLFEATEGSGEIEVEKPGGLMGLFKGKGKIEDAKLINITKYIGSAIDHQSRDMYEEAIEDLATAIDLGLSYPAVNFLLGFLYTKNGDHDRAHPILMRITESENYAIAANLLISKHFYTEGIIRDSLVYALQALKHAEISIVKEHIADAINDHYEKIIKDVKKGDDEQHLQFYENIMETIDSPDWRQNIINAKEQIPIADSGTLVIPIAEILQQTGSSLIIESMAKINEYSKRGFLDTALEEAYSLLNKAPSYLPLQVKIADMLIDRDRFEDALEKFGYISKTYYSRGETARARDLLLQVVEISPLHLDARNLLKDVYRELKQPKKVLREALNIADIYYKLANLDAAKASYIEAASVTDDIKDGFAIKKRILSTIADIDTQKLQWDDALETYRMMREIDPSDQENWKKIISLNIKLGNEIGAAGELDDCIEYLNNVDDGDVIGFLQDFINDNPRVVYARKSLANHYLENGQTEDGILVLDQVVQLYLEVGDTEEARSMIRKILGLEPVDRNKYQDLLKELD